MDAISDVSRGSEIFSAVPNRDPLPEPIDVDELLGFTEAIRRRDLRRGLLEDAEDKGVGKSKIFINHVDSYVGKYLVSVLSQKVSEMDLVDTGLTLHKDEDKGEEQSSLDKGSPKPSRKKEKSPKRSKAKGDKSPKKAESKKNKSPKKAESKKDKSSAKSKGSKKGGKKKEPKGPQMETDVEDFDEIVEEEPFHYDTSRLTVPEYYELMDLEPGEMRHKYLEEKLGKFLPIPSTEIKSIISVDKTVKSKKVIYTNNLEIIGTLRKEGSQEVPEGVKEIIQVQDFDEEFIKTLAECAAVVYVINEDFEQIHEATWVLTGLVNHLEDIKISGESHEYTPPIFILVSTFMTWALTDPFDPNRPNLPFIEKDYPKRTPHPNFQHHYGLEEQIVQLRANGCVDAVIVTCGIPYGHEENTLKYLFEMAFNCNDLPVFEPGSNHLPLVHVEHIGLIIKQVLKMKGALDTPFVFAIDPVSYQTTREIVDAISWQFGNGCIRKMSRIFSFLRDEITQDIYDEINANVVLDSCYPLFKEEDIKWRYPNGFVANIKNIAEEYISVNNLVPLRITFYYSHEEFKEVAQKLSDHYNVPLVSPRSVIQEYVNEVLDQLKSIEETKESLHQERSDELNDNRECKDDRFIVALDLIKHLDIKQAKDVRKLSEVQRMAILREGLKKRWYVNHGYILDNFPRTSEGTKVLFHFNGDDISKPLSQMESTALPNYVIYLKKCEEKDVSDSRVSQSLSTDDPIEEELDADDIDDEDINGVDEEISNQEEDTVKSESIKVKKKTFKRLPTKVIEFFLENNSGCRFIEKEIKNTLDLNKIFKDLVKAINASAGQETRDSKTSDQEMDQVSLSEHTPSLKKEKTKESINLQPAENVKNHLEKEKEEQILAIRSVPYIKYLINYIFPTLTNALLEVCDKRPTDPLDFIAKYLFQNNPDGRMLDPTDEIRRKEMIEKNKGVMKVDSKTCLA